MLLHCLRIEYLNWNRCYLWNWNTHTQKQQLAVLVKLIIHCSCVWGLSYLQYDTCVNFWSMVHTICARFIYDRLWEVHVSVSCPAAQVYAGTGVGLSVMSCQYWSQCLPCTALHHLSWKQTVIFSSVDVILLAIPCLPCWMQ